MNANQLLGSKHTRGFCSRAEKASGTEISAASAAKSDKWRNFYNQFSRDFTDLAEELERRKYNKRLIIFAGVGVFGFATYGFFRNLAAKEVVLISSKTFDDENFKRKAVTLAKDGIRELCESSEVQRDVTNLLEKSVVDLISRDNVQNQLAGLVAKAVQSNQVKDVSKESIKLIVNDLINSEENVEFRKGVSNYLASEIQTQLSNKANQDTASKFTKKAFFGMFW